MRTDALADDVVQETWLAVLKGLDRFEERSSLKTWIFRILVNRARTRAVREARQVPFSSLATGEDQRARPWTRRVFNGDGAWATPPAQLDVEPETRAARPASCAAASPRSSTRCPSSSAR